MSDLLSSFDLLEGAGLNPSLSTAPYRTLDRWVRDGIILPSVNANVGSGYKRGWGTRGRRTRLLCIDWPALGTLVRSHPGPGWLVIDRDGQMDWTDEPAQAVAWQESSSLAVCVRVEAA